MAESEVTPIRLVEGFTPWLLVALASLAGIGAVLRVGFATDVRLLERLDHTTLLYLAVGGGLLMLREVRSLSFGGYKLEMLEKVKEKQSRQEDQIEDIVLMLPLLLPRNERVHLVNLARGKTPGYQGNHSLRAELRRLRSLGLIRLLPDQHVAFIKDGSSFDLAAYVELTDLGERWVRRIQQIEKADAAHEETAGS